MLDQGPLSPVDQISAKIQGRVATFLGLRELLTNISRVATSLDDRTKVAKLLSMQTSLELQLNETLALIERIKTGSYNYSELLLIGNFYWKMEGHIKEVTTFAETKSVIQAKKEGVGSWLPYLTAGSLVLGMYGFFFKGKK